MASPPTAPHRHGRRRRHHGHAGSDAGRQAGRRPHEPAPTEAALDHRLVAATAPQSLAAGSAARCARGSERRAGADDALIVITSPNKGTAGLTAANLALTMAQEFQRRVLLVVPTCAVRHPSPVHFADRQGLTDVLMGGAARRRDRRDSGAAPGRRPQIRFRRTRRNCRIDRHARVLDALRTLAGSSSTCAGQAARRRLDRARHGRRAADDRAGGATPKAGDRARALGLDTSKSSGSCSTTRHGGTPQDGYHYVAG